jgi:hypothetical protein
MDRRGFLAGLAGVAIVPPWRVPRTRAVPVQTWPVYATLVGPGGARSEPVQFDARWAVPPLMFVAPRAGTWTHVEMTDGERVKLQELFPSVATWTDEGLRVRGVTWS